MKSESPTRPPLAGTHLHASHPDRCQVCALPLPNGESTDGICSKRCAGLRRESAAVQQTAEAVTDRILSLVAALQPGTTICPGALSQQVRPGLENPLTVLRPLIFSLAAEGRLRLKQKGAVVLWWKIKGPFRVGK